MQRNLLGEAEGAEGPGEEKWKVGLRRQTYGILGQLCGLAGHFTCPSLPFLTCRMGRLLGPSLGFRRIRWNEPPAVADPGVWT